jgi:hypothetical protein
LLWRLDIVLYGILDEIIFESSLWRGGCRRNGFRGSLTEKTREKDLCAKEMAMQRRSQKIKEGQRRVLARVLSMPDDLRLVRGGSLGPDLGSILTASLPGRDYSSPTFEEGEPTL